jgi:hypothetical protein
VRFIDDIWPAAAGEGPVLIVNASLGAVVSRAVAERFLRDGCEVQIAGDSQEALTQCEYREPSLVVLGEIDDDGDAVRFLRVLQRRLNRGDTRVCVITGTWRRFGLEPDGESVVAVSPGFALSEFLDITRELRAA